MEEEIRIAIDDTTKRELLDLLKRGYSTEQIFKIGMSYIKHGGDDILLKIYNKLFDLDVKMTMVMLMFTGLLKLLREKAMMISDATYALIGSFPRIHGEEEVEMILSSVRDLLNFVNESESFILKAVKESKKEELVRIIDELREMVK